MELAYSVIIPCYNNFNLLEKLLLTIPETDDKEVIIVDDCSEERSFLEFKDKQKNRKDLKIFRNVKNIGAGGGRNIGIKNSIGKWLIFADADDLFTKDAFMYFDEYKDSDYQLVYFCANRIKESGELAQKKFSISEKRCIDDFLLKGKEKELKATQWAPWGKMFLRNYIVENNITYHEIRTSEDAYFVINASLNANKICASKNKVYTYYVYNDSNCRQVSLENSLIRINEQMILNNLYLSNKGYSFYVFDFYMRALKILKNNGLKTIKFIKEIKKRNNLNVIKLIFFTTVEIIRCITVKVKNYKYERYLK